MTYCTARSVAPRTIPGLEKPKAPTYASYPESQLAAMMQADAKKLPLYQRKEERDTRDAVLATMAAFHGQEASFATIRDRCKSVAESTLRKRLLKLVDEGILIKGYVTAQNINLITYKLPVVK